MGLKVYADLCGVEKSHRRVSRHSKGGKASRGSGAENGRAKSHAAVNRLSHAQGGHIRNHFGVSDVDSLWVAGINRNRAVRAEPLISKPGSIWNRDTCCDGCSRTSQRAKSIRASTIVPNKNDVGLNV